MSKQHEVAWQNLQIRVQAEKLAHIYSPLPEIPQDTFSHSKGALAKTMQAIELMEVWKCSQINLPSINSKTNILRDILNLFWCYYLINYWKCISMLQNKIILVLPFYQFSRDERPKNKFPNAINDNSTSLFGTKQWQSMKCFGNDWMLATMTTNPPPCSCSSRWMTMD